MARNIEIFYPMVGQLIPLNEVDDRAFSSGKMGRGVAIKNPEGKVFSPFDGLVEYITPAKNVIGLTSNDGIELLIQIGINTHKLNGQYFNVFVEQNEVVKKGQVLLEFDPRAIAMAGYDITSPVVVTNDKDFGNIKFETAKNNSSTSTENYAQGDDEMEGRKFTILGETGSGKTCYLLGMYYEMTMGVARYTVFATNPDDDRNLTLRYKRLKDKSLGQGRFPAGTEQVEKLNFQLQYANETIMPFEWVDYPGGFLDTTKHDLSSNEYKEVEKSILESEMLFICIDGANLTGDKTRNKIRKVKERCAKHINPYLTALINKNEEKQLPPIAMLITKYDLCMDNTDEDEIQEIVEGAFESLFDSEDNNNFVAVIPVSLGDTLQDDSYQGDLEPINIHLPILMGIQFALIDQLKLGKFYIEDQSRELAWARNQYEIENDRWGITRWLFGGYDPDELKKGISELDELIKNNRRVCSYFKKSLKRMNKELEAVEMIFANGAWQDERHIRKMWADIQSIADYKF